MARLRDLVALGCTRHDVSVARGAGEIVDVARGLVSLPGTGIERLAAARLHGTLTCTTALGQRGVAVLHSPQFTCVEVDRASGAASRRPDGVRLHFRTGAPTPRRAMRVAPVPEALDAAGSCLDEREHLVAVDSALHQGLVRPDQIAAFTRATRRRREWLLAHMDGRAESPPETLARLDLARAGIAVHPQRYVEGVGRVDLVAGDRAVVEVDGRQHHDNPAAFQRDRYRDRELLRRGYVVLRFTYRDLCGAAPISVADAVRAALAAARTPSPSPR
ncbi:endonuclease domain-containing protein [Demequina sp. NBRC 110051]|uniref:endonuclease domain-containing protein n=1 Tax=Demequina sp. NBRC 110051 TaxID=1570340 RepID=UPI001356471C|nr:DUF559 domain-containing protein [Demequina sp. NBRC 110051]